jgi:Tol biopolymer transport system component
VNVSSSGVLSNGVGDTERPVLSADGRFVAFYSEATNLVRLDRNGKGDVFVHDRQAGTTERVSVDSLGGEGDGESGRTSHAISANGRYVVFVSDATNLVPDDTNDTNDVFVHDREMRITERVSSGLGDYTRGFRGVAISADGRIVAFGAHSVACWTCRVFSEVFVHDRQSHTTELISVDADGSPILDDEDQDGENGGWYPAVSADGRIVVFGTHLGIVFVHDRQTGLSQPTNLPSGDRALGFQPHAVSGDGRFIVSSVSGNSIYVHDLLTGRTEAFVDGIAPSISHDGRLIAFQSAATYLVPDDAYNTHDVFVRVR